MTSKRSKLGLNHSPSSSSVYNPEPPLSASSKLSRSDSQDISQVIIFLESLSAWLNGYFFSRLSLNCAQLPLTPRLDNLELHDVCNTLRSTIGSVREQAIKKIQSDKADQMKSGPGFSVKGLRAESDDKRMHILLDNAMKEAKRRGYSVNILKQGLYEKCEEVCNCLQLSISEGLSQKNRLNDLEGQMDFSKTRRTDEYSSLNKSRQEADMNMAQVIYPLITRVNSLQEKKQFYALLFRHYERFIKHEEEEIRKMLDPTKVKAKRKIKIRSVFLSVFAAVCIKNLLIEDDKITLKGIKVKLLDTSLLPNKTVTIKSLPGIISSIHKSVGGSVKQRSTLNSLISSSISIFQKFMNDVKTILTILLKNSTEQKEVVQTLNNNIKELEEERDELEGALTRTVEYTKNLEEEIMEMTGDPEYLRQIGEETEMSLELESHKKALKGLTSQYNQLEHRMDLMTREYEELKKEYLEKSRKLEDIEGKKKG